MKYENMKISVQTDPRRMDIVPKWVRNPSKINVGRYVQASSALGASWNHQKLIFTWFLSPTWPHKAPKMDPNIDEKSVPKQHGSRTLRGPSRKGSQTLWRPSGPNFEEILDNFQFYFTNVGIILASPRAFKRACSLQHRAYSAACNIQQTACSIQRKIMNAISKHSRISKSSPNSMQRAAYRGERGRERERRREGWKAKRSIEFHFASQELSGSVLGPFLVTFWITWIGGTGRKAFWILT